MKKVVSILFLFGIMFVFLACTRDNFPTSTVDEETTALVLPPYSTTPSNIIITDKYGNIFDTGIEDKVLDDGMTITQKIQECARNARNHGDFVSCIAHLTNWLMKNGFITNKEKGIIMNIAARADIP